MKSPKHKEFVTAMENKSIALKWTELTREIATVDSRVIGREAIRSLESILVAVRLAGGFCLFTFVLGGGLGFASGRLDTKLSMCVFMAVGILGAVIFHLLEDKVKSHLKEVKYNLVVESIIIKKSLYKHLIFNGLEIQLK